MRLVECLPFGHAVIEIVEFFSNRFRSYVPVVFRLGIEWESEVWLCKRDGYETTATPQQTTDLNTKIDPLLRMYKVK